MLWYCSTCCLVDIVIIANAFDNIGNSLPTIIIVILFLLSTYTNCINASLNYQYNEDYTSLGSCDIWNQKQDAQRSLSWKQKPSLELIHLCQLHVRIWIDGTFQKSGMCELLQCSFQVFERCHQQQDADISLHPPSLQNSALNTISHT
jgi:hypothetical protein